MVLDVLYCYGVNLYGFSTQGFLLSSVSSSRIVVEDLGVWIKSPRFLSAFILLDPNLRCRPLYCLSFVASSLSTPPPTTPVASLLVLLHSFEVL